MYDLISVHLPKVSGLPLRLLRWLLEWAPSRALLAPGLLKNAGVSAYRQHTETSEASVEPVVLPAWPTAPAAEAHTITVANQTTSPVWLSAQHLHEAYTSGSRNPESVAEALIAARQTDAYRQLNAYIGYDDDALRRDAAASAARYRAGAPRGILDGIPVSIKDEFAVSGYVSGDGTSFLGQQPAPADASAVARLRAAGALIVGKGQMHEIGLGVVGTSRAHGPARNPYNPAHTAGGSSGGGAAASASGLAVIALGADGGGSIRVPASFCGMVGLKGTYGRISSHGTAGVVWSMSNPGPIAPTPADVAAAYMVMAGADAHDPRTTQQPTPTAADLTRRDLRGVSIGYMPAWFEHADSEIVAQCRSMLHYYRGAGAHIQEISVAGLEAARVAHTIIITTEMLKALEQDLKTHGHLLADETRLSLAISREFRDDDVRHAQQTRTTFTRTLRDIFARVDLIATPTAGLLAPPITPAHIPHGMSDLSSTFEIMRYAFAANLSGVPSISIPAGYSKHGLPIGFQLMARPWHEALLLEAANVAEQWRNAAPPKLFFHW
jgi:Asp-tRNA(Asn)/Glu-tRNA(Gln) amidotransferase A subunit family amidase